MLNSYETVKNFVFKKLQSKIEVSGLLETEDIKDEITKLKELLAKPDVAFLLFNIENITLSDAECDNLIKELETLFDVRMDQGFLIQGTDQQSRYEKWWSDEIKQTSELYYWKRYKQYLLKSLPFDIVKTIDTDTDVVMNNIENPAFESFSRYGMVVGHVQSGKTANYTALICKAADAGYKFIVIIAGGINNLRNQTQARINEGFIGRDNSGNQVGAGIGNSNAAKLPISLTTVERDFNKQDADRNSQGHNFDNTNTPIVLVIKKHTTTLANVIKWLESQYKNKIEKHSMLLIDDESDYASINTNEENDPTRINARIRKLISLFNKSCYVAYTATPYANIFIDHEAIHEDVGEDLFPSDFIYALDAPGNYFGARKIFIDSDNKHLELIDDYIDVLPLNHRKLHIFSDVPQSMYKAVISFMINIAVRHIRGQENKHNSMLIHATRYTIVHQRLSALIENYIDNIKTDVLAYGMLDDACKQSTIIKGIREIYLNRNDIEDKPDWDAVIKTLSAVIQTVVVREVHQSSRLSLEYRKDRPTNAIVVGGTSVSRGFTLEGLSITYFLRNTVYYDTLMQMGRWFGYRDGYEDLCKIYLTETMADNFRKIIEATEDLISDFKMMSEAKKTPRDFGLAVRQHPDSALQVTARNKQRNVQEFVFNMRLDGMAKESSWLPLDDDARKSNLALIDKTITGLLNDYEHEVILNNYLWRNVNKEVVLGFIEQFSLYSNDPLGLNSRMPVAFVKQYIEERETEWDIAVYSGKGAIYKIASIKFQKETRQASKKNDLYIEIKNRQVGSGNVESIALEESLRKELKSERKEIRKHLSRPLLMLHVLEVTDSNTAISIDNALAAYGVSFPGDVISGHETINLKINTVYYRNLMDSIELEEESDD